MADSFLNKWGTYLLAGHTAKDRAGRAWPWTGAPLRANQRKGTFPVLPPEQPPGVGASQG